MISKRFFYITLIFFHCTDASCTPENTIIIFDIDEVLIRPRNDAHEYVVTHIRDEYKQDARALLDVIERCNFDVCDSSGCRALSPIAMFLLIACQYAHKGDYRFCRVVHEVVRLFNKAQEPIEGMYQLVLQLKKQGYTICCATNRDQLSFEYCKNTSPVFELIEHVFVSYPCIAASMIPDMYKTCNDSYVPIHFIQFVDVCMRSHAGGNVMHVPGRKPYDLYFDCMSTKLEHMYGCDKQYIFIDDRIENVLAAQRHGMKGIHFSHYNMFSDKHLLYNIFK